MKKLVIKSFSLRLDKNKRYYELTINLADEYNHIMCFCTEDFKLKDVFDYIDKNFKMEI